MKIIKYLFLLACVLFIGAVSYIALLEGGFQVHEQIELEAPRQLVFQKIENLKSWKNWAIPSEGKREIDFSEQANGKSALISWQESQGRGEGRLKTIKKKQNTIVQQKAVRKRNVRRIDYSVNWSFNAQEDSIQVSLDITGHLNYWSKVNRVFGEGLEIASIDKQVQKSLQRLKTEVLHEMRQYTVEIDGVTKEKSKYYIYRRLTIKNDPKIILNASRSNRKRMEEFLAENNLSARGEPFIIFYSEENKAGDVELAVALTLAGKPEVEMSGNDFVIGKRPAQHQVKSTLKGGYENIPELWESVNSYMKKNDLNPDDKLAPYMVFKVSSEERENPADWVTEIFVPLQKHYQ